MKQKGKVVGLVLAVLMILTVGLVGCAGESEGTTETPTEAATDAAAETPADDTTADTATEAPADTGADETAEAPAETTGDGGGEEAVASDHDDSEPLVFGVSYQWLGDDYMKNMQEVLQSYAAEHNITLDEKNSEMNTEEQVKHIENFITSEVDVIIYQPNDSTTGIPYAKQAIEAGIPVITINTVLQDQESFGVYSSTTDNQQAGILVAEYMCKALLKGEGSVVILHGAYGATSSDDRQEGYEMILPYYENVSVAFEDAANWGREEAYQKMANWLATGEEINGVMSSSSEMAIGAMLACEEAGRDDIFHVTVDSSEETDRYIAEGRMDGVVLHDSRALAQVAMEMGEMMARDLGTPTKQTVYVPHALITLENLQDYAGKMKSFEG